MKQKDKKTIYTIAGIALIGILIFFYVSIYNLDNETKLLKNNLAEAIIDYESKITELNEDLDEQNTFFNNMISNLQEENQKGEKRLEDLIEKVESQSSIQLDELKTELKNINIKSLDFSAIVQDVLESVVSVMTNKGQGSGAFVDDSGYIVTNHHVIYDATSIRVLTYDNKIHNAKLVGYNAGADIAVLKIENDYPYLDFGDSDEVKIGEKVIALGNPGGLDFTVTEGIVSAKRSSSAGIQFIQTDVPINPGNSGGPLVSIQSEIIGINEFKVQGFEGLGFAIASNLVDEITSELISKDRQQE